MRGTENTSQFLKSSVKSVIDDPALILVDADQSDVLTSICSCEGRAERFKGTAAVGTMRSMECD